MWNKQSIN